MTRRPGSHLGLMLLASLAGATACQTAAGSTGRDSGADAVVTRRSVEDVFLLSGELAAVRQASIVAPRGEALQIRWMAEDGTDVKEGERVIEFDAARLIQSIEELRLKVRQAENERESRARAVVAEGDTKRVAVEKADVEAKKARIDAAVPRELRPAVEWAKFQATSAEKEAALQKARLDQEAYRTSSRSDLEVLRRIEEKARRELEVAEKALLATSVRAPRSGIFLSGNFWQWGPEGPRKLQPGDTVWPNFPVASIPDPTEMEVSAALSEVDHGRIGAGMKTRCILDTYPDRVFEGRIEDVGAVAAESARSFGLSTARTGFPVRVSLAVTDPIMRPGLSVRVEVLRAAWPQALVVPRHALHFEKEQVVVVRKGLGGRTVVRVAGCTPVDCAVESGLNEGDHVLLP
ncbi:MAG TPA: HlyD family efflux transporter periplasmic adaptor subunit [Candidatus Polarisedimenticolia bacterium]|nr:HlyD family efflux transporter periplasmic adaptor subunit [Candidatus Polarisedimenticolia bacterium]